MLLQAIQTQIALAADMEAIVRRLNGSPKYKKQTATLQGRLDTAKRALKRCNGLYDSLYQSYVDQLMTEQEYMTLKRRYKAEAEEAEPADRGSDSPTGGGSGAHAGKPVPYGLRQLPGRGCFDKRNGTGADPACVCGR